jgi:hypothetical protein
MGSLPSVRRYGRMPSGTERAFDDAFALGRQNQVTVELARRHSLNMEFPEFGGRGMAEEVSGLTAAAQQNRMPDRLGSFGGGIGWQMGRTW